MRIRDEVILFTGKLQGIRETVERPDGVTFIHETIRHPGAVVILPISDTGTIVMIEQYRHSIRETILELPAGTVEPGEDPGLCARRELSEEIGMAAREWTALGFLYPAPGFCNEKQHLFAARGLEPAVLPQDEDEIITVREMTLGEVRDAISNGVINDAKTAALLFRAMSRGIIPSA